MNLREFKNRLDKHDWYYASSDDGRVYEKGLEEEKSLKLIMEGKVTYQKAYNSQFNKYFKTNKNERS